jgi:hypothetical protein
MAKTYQTQKSENANSSDSNRPEKTITKQIGITDAKAKYKYTMPPMDQVLDRFPQISGVGALLQETVPEMNPEDFHNVATAVERDGFLSSVKVNKNGEVLDGRGLLAVAYVLGIEPPVEVTDADPLALATANYARRHMTSGQLAIVAKRLLRFLKPAAAERRNATLRKGRNSPVHSNWNGREAIAGEAVDIAANMTGTSRSSVYRAMKLSPEAEEKVWSGELTLGAAESADRKRKAASATSHDTVTDAEESQTHESAITTLYESDGVHVYGHSKTPVHVFVYRLALDDWRVVRTDSDKSSGRKTKQKAFMTAVSILSKLVSPDSD